MLQGGLFREEYSAFFVQAFLGAYFFFYFMKQFSINSVFCKRL